MSEKNILERQLCLRYSHKHTHTLSKEQKMILDGPGGMDAVAFCQWTGVTISSAILAKSERFHANICCCWLYIFYAQT